MNPESLPARIRLALGGKVTVERRLPSADGAVRYVGRRGADAALVTVFPRAPEGPTPEELRSLVDRFRAAQHQAIATPHDAADIDGVGCLVTSYHDLPTAADRLRNGLPMASAQAIDILRDVARALASLHRRGLAHGGLTLDAIHVGPDGAIVAGLGNATIAKPVVDLRAFGRVAYALLAGVEPTSPAAPLARHRRALPPELHRLIDGLVDGTTRPPRAEAILDLLDAVRSGRPAQQIAFLDGAAHGSRLPRPLLWQLVVAAGAVLLVAMLVSAGR